MPDVSRTFLDESRRFLTHEYMPLIERSVGRLSAEQLWSRSNEASNSVGNLLLHLTGSTRYWASHVIGKEPTARVRQEEFDRRERIPSKELLEGLRAAVGEADRRLKELGGEQLLETRAARDEEFTVLWCVYHMVEHFAMHTGQIASMAKALAGEI